MGKHAHFVVGPAGTGKSTYCASLARHCETLGRSVHVANLDPAADTLGYDCSIDVRDLISLTDVVREFNLGPNGGLVYCMEYFASHIDWFMDEIGDFADDYLIIDCPGQIELYTHMTVLRTVADQLKSAGYFVGCVFLVDSTFVVNSSRFVAACLTALSCMVRLELPHLNVLSKVDLLKREMAEAKVAAAAAHRSKRAAPVARPREDDDEEEENEELMNALERYLDVNVWELLGDSESNEISAGGGPRSAAVRHAALTNAIGKLLEDYNMVRFFPLDLTMEDSLNAYVYQLDLTLQYGDDVEPKDVDHLERAQEANEGGGDGVADVGADQF